MSEETSKADMSEIIRIDETRIKDRLGQIARRTVE